jgi:hypothetical protein
MMANLTFNIDDDTKEIARQFIRAINGLAKVIRELPVILNTDAINTDVIHIRSEGSDEPIRTAGVDGQHLGTFTPGKSGPPKFADGND